MSYSVLAQQQIQLMTPSLWDYFSSFFYSNTTVSPIDLEGNLRAGKYQCPHDDVVKIAQRITSNEEVQKVLSETLSYQPEEIQEKGGILEQHGFRQLSSKPLLLPTGDVQSIPYYNVCEHDDLDGWIIKSGARRIPEDSIQLSLLDDRNEMALFTQHESLLRFEMGERLRQAAQKRGIELVMPDEYAIPYANLKAINQDGVDVTKKYFVVSEKLDVLTVDETVQVLQNDRELQKLYASSVITLIEEAGYSDTSIDNIRLTRNHKITILDTEPAGLLTKQGNELYPQGGNLEKHVRIGLYNLQSVAEQNGLDIVAEQARQHYHAAINSVSITKIALTALSCLIPVALLITTIAYPSLLNQVLTQNQILAVQITAGSLTPLLPVVLLTISAVKRQSLYNEAKKIVEGDMTFQMENGMLAMTNPQEYLKIHATHQRDTVSLRRSYFSHIEGVPFQSAMA